MSRIGRLPVVIPGGVDVKVDGSTVTVKGPKGQLARTFHPNVRIAREDGKITVNPGDETNATRALHGLTRTLIANMVAGVTTGFAKDLEISGTGYRAVLQGKKLQLALGFSHPIEIDPPAGITFTVETPQKLKVSGVDKEGVGEVAAKDATGSKTERAKAVGSTLGERAKAKGIDEAVFDRGGYRYHGRIKALGDAARSAGLRF